MQSAFPNPPWKLISGWPVGNRPGRSRAAYERKGIGLEWSGSSCTRVVVDTLPLKFLRLLSRRPWPYRMRVWAEEQRVEMVAAETSLNWGRCVPLISSNCHHRPADVNIRFIDIRPGDPSGSLALSASSIDRNFDGARETNGGLVLLNRWIFVLGCWECLLGEEFFLIFYQSVCEGFGGQVVLAMEILVWKYGITGITQNCLRRLCVQ